MQELYNLRRFIQHLIDENQYEYDKDECTNPLSESHWIYHTNKHFMKYVFFILQEMTPEQLKQNPITVHPNPIDTDEGESNNDEEESTTYSEMLEYNSESDTTANDTEEEIPQEIQIIYLSNQHMMKLIHLKTNLQLNLKHHK